MNAEIFEFIEEHRLMPHTGRPTEGIPCWQGLCDKPARKLRAPRSYQEVEAWRSPTRRVWVDLENLGLIVADNGEVIVEIARDPMHFQTLLQRTRNYFLVVS